jgi:hypothetical protein
MGFIYQKNLERYFNAYGIKSTEQDHFAIIRRIDMDADSKINQQEFIEFIRPQEPFSKMVVRARCAKRGERKPLNEILELSKNQKKQANSKCNS